MVGRLRVAAGAATMLLTGFAGAGAAQAADPAFHCQASTATIKGVGLTTPVAPLTAGGTGPCANASVGNGPALPSNPVLDAHVLADTTYDAAAKKGTATGGLLDLKVLQPPNALPEIPGVTDFIAGIQPLHQTLSVLTIPLPPLPPVPIPISVPVLIDVQDAVTNLLAGKLPAAGTPLLSTGLVTATATVTCQSNAAALSGSHSVASVTALGQSLPTDAAVTRSFDLVGTQTIPLSSLPLSDLDILAGDGSPLDPALVGPVKTALAALLPTLTNPIPLPSLALNVSLTPGAETRVGDSLVETALTAKVDLSGLHLLDADIGEARVSADAGVCAQPPTPVDQQPAPPDQGGVDAITATGSVADQILACSDRKLVLMDVLRRGTMVKILGAANRDYAGRQVAIRLKATRRVVGHATVQKDGSFQTLVPRPPARFAGRAKADLVRYTAEIGAERSLPLKLDRRMIVSHLTSQDGKVTINGRVVGPLTTPVTTIRLMRRLSCKAQALVATFKPGRDGRFTITVDAPTGQVAAVYRLATSVRANTHNPKRFPTFTLPRGVALDQR